MTDLAERARAAQRLYELVSRLSGEAERREARELIAALELAAKAAPDQERDGWKLVPVEPTREMCVAACNSEEQDDLDMWAETWRTMLAAAPKPEDT